VRAVLLVLLPLPQAALAQGHAMSQGRAGPEVENILFSYPITAHYRYAKQ
jgi:hypothetical protein